MRLYSKKNAWIAADPDAVIAAQLREKELKCFGINLENKFVPAFSPQEGVCFPVILRERKPHWNRRENCKSLMKNCRDQVVISPVFLL